MANLMNNNNKTNSMNNKGGNSMSKFNVKPSVRSYVINKNAGKALNDALYAVMPVIYKCEFRRNEETNEIELVSKELGTSNNSPVIRAFGLSDKVMRNAVIKTEDMYGNEHKIVIDITPDGKYPLCENIILVKGDGEDETILAELTRDGVTIEGERYEVASVSPSQEKQGSKFFARLTDKVKDQLAIFNIIEEINGYVYTNMFKDLVDGKDILKANSRLGNYGSNMLCLATIDLSKERIAVVHKEKQNGKVVNEGSIYGSFDYAPEVKAMMDAQGIKIDNHINDGACYLSAAVNQRIFEAVGVDLTEEEAYKAALQVRISHVTAKCMERALSQSDMERIAKHYNAKFYGPENAPIALLVDEDGAKLINKTDLANGTAVLKVYVMAMAKANRPHSSGQHLIKYMNVDAERTTQIMYNMTFNALDEYVVGQVYDGNNHSTQYAEIRNNVGEASFRERFLVESLIKDELTFASGAVAKNRLTLDGVYSHMMFDLSYALTEGRVSNILGINKYGLIEAYSEDVCRIYAKDIAEIENDATLTEEEKELKLQAKLSAIVVKFPSAMPDEYEVVVYKTRKQMMNKIKAVASNEDKEVLLQYFNRTPWGCTVFAPINTLKNKLAGADVDFDACMSDMSELKDILVERRMKDTMNLGKCVFISYNDIDRKAIAAAKNEEDEAADCL
jgi:hypothetical protein